MNRFRSHKALTKTILLLIFGMKILA